MSAAAAIAAQPGACANLDRLAALSRREGEAEWLSTLRKRSFERFAAAAQDFGKYSRLRLDWGALPVAQPLFSKPYLNVPGTTPARPAPLSEVASGDGEFLRKSLVAKTPWDELVLAAWREGLLLRWAEGDEGGAVPYLALGGAAGLVLEPVVLDVQERADALLFLHWRGGDQPSLHLSTLLGRVADGARLRLFILHEGEGAHHHLSAHFDLGQDARVELFSAWMGGKWSVARTSVDMPRPGATWSESHLVMASGKDHLDLDSQVRHGNHHTRSDVQVKTVAAGSSRAVFTGNILMEKAANLGEAFLSDHVMLLSPEARADSIPGLEIKALDVKASHAASVGQVDEDQMFYLMSRGLDPSRARNLIVVGFLESLFARAPFDFVGETLNPILEEKVVA